MFTTEELTAFVGTPRFDATIVGRKDARWPRITVVVPSYNQARFLERTLLSILNQNYPNLELFVLDGGSQDGSVEILERYDEFIDYWQSAPDGGQAAAINGGFQRATGDLVAWQNSDDVYVPHAFFRIAKAYRAYPSHDIYHGHLLFIDADDTILDEVHYAPFSLWNARYLGIGVANQSSWFRRHVVKQVHLDCTLQCALDGDYFLRLGLQRFKYRLLPEFYGCLRQHEATKTRNATASLRLQEGSTIRRRAGVEVRTDVPWSRQFRVRKAIAQLRNLAYFVRHDRPYVGMKMRKLSEASLVRVGLASRAGSSVARGKC